jgi:hypothetical protein
MLRRDSAAWQPGERQRRSAVGCPQRPEPGHNCRENSHRISGQHCFESKAKSSPERSNSSGAAGYDSARSTASSLAPQRESEVLAQLAQRREELAKKLGEIDVAKQQRKEREAVKAPFDGTSTTSK